jgi:hypothetical protein
VKVPCESKEKPETCAGENESDVSKKLEGAPESRENGEKFLRPRHTIYRGKGGHSQECASIRPLRDLRRTRVHSDVPRVTFFYQSS